MSEHSDNFKYFNQHSPSRKADSTVSSHYLNSFMPVEPVDRITALPLGNFRVERRDVSLLRSVV